MRIAYFCLAAVLALGACERRDPNTVTRNEVAEILSKQIATVAGYTLSSDESRERFDAARVERRRGAIDARAAMNDGIERLLAVNGLAVGMVEVNTSDDSPFFTIDLTNEGWGMLQRAFEQERGPLEFQVTKMENLECRDADDGVRECAADIRMRLRSSALWRPMFGTFRSDEFEGRPVFQRSIETGEWRLARWGREPRAVDGGDVNDVNEALERFVKALPAERVQAFDARITTALQPRFETARTEAQTLENNELSQRGMIIGAVSGNRVPVSVNGVQYELATQVQRASTVWGLMEACWNLRLGGNDDWYLSPSWYSLTRRTTVFDGADAAADWRRDVLDQAAPADAGPRGEFSFFSPLAGVYRSSLQVSPTSEDNNFISTVGAYPSGPDGSARYGYWSAPIRNPGFGAPTYRYADTSQLTQPLANGGRYRGICMRGGVNTSAAPADAATTTP